MFGSLKGRLLTIAGVVVIALVVLIRNGISLGLDLQGGMYLALEVQDPNGTLTDEQRRDFTDQNLEILRNRIDQFGVTEPNVQKVGDQRIIVELPGIRDEERAKNVIRQQAFLEWKLVRPSRDLLDAVERMDRAVVAALGPEGLAAARAQTGDTAASVAQGGDVRDILFGRADTASADSLSGDSATAPAGPADRPLSSLLLQGSGEGEFLVAESDVQRVREYLALPGVLAALPRGAGLAWGAEPAGAAAQLYRPLYVLEDDAFLTGERLEEAIAGRDPQFGETQVTFQLDRRGGRIFEDITSEHIGDRIAIVLDTLVHSAPSVNGRIGASGVIQMGQGTPMQEAQDLALVLRAGAFAAPLDIVEQRSVGPSLGRDSVDQGKIAGMIGILLVLVIMVAYYRVAGALSVGALAIYVLLVLAGLAGFEATLTAPGIAGLILSIGMAVDANVLIFERIREELAAGRATRAAVDVGFKEALSAIVDSNLTTLITAMVLFQIGTGPVRGFAVTLSIGIIASFFSAVFITKTFFLLYLNSRKSTAPISI